MRFLAIFITKFRTHSSAHNHQNIIATKLTEKKTHIKVTGDHPIINNSNPAIAINQRTEKALFPIFDPFVFTAKLLQQEKLLFKENK